MLRRIDKRLFDVPGSPVISSCGTFMQKVSELFLDHVLKPVLQRSRSYNKNSRDFVKKLKEIKEVSKDAIMATAEVIDLYPSFPHNDGVETIRRTLDERVNRKIGTEDFIKMRQFVLKNSYFKFNGKAKQQLSETAIRTKFTSLYACILMNQVETEFLEL